MNLINLTANTLKVQILNSTFMLQNKMQDVKKSWITPIFSCLEEKFFTQMYALCRI